MTAVMAIVYADVANFPAGSVVANIVATVTGSAAPVSQTVPPGTSSISFDLPPDTYNFSVAGVDASNNIFGTPVTGSFVIAAPNTVTLSLPSTVTVSAS